MDMKVKTSKGISTIQRLKLDNYRGTVRAYAMFEDGKGNCLQSKLIGSFPSYKIAKERYEEEMNILNS